MSRQEEPPSERRSSSGRTVDARQLWSGGAATAVVAALIALVGILVCRWLFNIPVLAPRQDGAWGDASTAGYAIAAAAAALVATAIMHLLLIATPRPQMFFTWILGLATVIAIRASDQGRENAAALLSEAYAVGRLGREELDERAAAAYSAGI